MKSLFGSGSWIDMKLLAWLTEFFLSVFGITRPRPDQLRKANLIVGGLMLAVLVLVCAVILLILVF